MILVAIALAICPVHGERVTCVVDGDTFWWRGEKVRLLGVDAPELHGRCADRVRATAARDRLAQLLGAGKVQLRRHGKDVFGRALAEVSAGGRDVGKQLLAEGWATVWPHRRHEGCPS